MARQTGKFDLKLERRKNFNTSEAMAFKQKKDGGRVHLKIFHKSISPGQGEKSRISGWEAGSKREDRGKDGRKVKNLCARRS